MLKKHHYFIIVSLIVIFIFITFLFLGSRINFEANEKFISNLRHLQATDAILNQYLLRLRNGTLPTVDPINKQLKVFKSLHKTLYQIPNFITQTGHLLITKQLDEFEQLLIKKEKLIERFKAENATLQTSITYFPSLTQTLVDDLVTHTNTQHLTINLQTLLRDVLIYNLNLKPALLPKILEQIESLETIVNHHKVPVDRTHLTNVILQVKTILKMKPETDRLLRELLYFPTIQHTEKIAVDYDHYYNYALQMANFYRLSLYMVCILLLIYIAWLIIRHLERRVRAATFQINQYAEDLKDTLERERRLSIEKEKMGAYIPKQLVDEISRGREQKLALGGKTIQATILFSDIQAFTKLSESLDPQEVITCLNTYMTAMAEVIEMQEGLIDKFIGDGIMAVFTVQTSTGNHALHAVQAGIEMQKRLKTLQSQWIDSSPLFSELKMRIGINTGVVVAGNIGSETRMDYTVVGDNVNVASRIESICEPDMVFISASTYESVKQQITAEAMPPIQVKNRRQPVQIYAIHVT